MSKADIQKIYDQEAATYDARYLEPIHLVEDTIIRKLIKSAMWPEFPYQFQDIVDVGCGTGHVIKLADIAPHTYRGIDISDASIKVAQRKFPNHSFQAADIMDLNPKKKCDLMLFIYGQVNYLGLDNFVQLLNRWLKVNKDTSKYMAVLYCGNGHEDYGYSTEHQNYYTPDQIRETMDEMGYYPWINGFSFYDCGDDVEKQLGATLHRRIYDGDEYSCKYLIVSNMDMLDNGKY